MILLNHRALITPNSARALCSMVLLCAHRHGVKFDFMAELLDDVAGIQVTLADLECAGRMRMVLATADAERDPKTLDARIEELCHEWIRLRATLTEKLKLIMACRQPGTTVN
jgi:hypothetical protein